jgi:hypothetical protein
MISVREKFGVINRRKARLASEARHERRQGELHSHYLYTA